MTTRTTLVVAAVLSSACAHSSGTTLPVTVQGTVARAPLEARSGSTMNGEANFMADGNDIVLTLHVTGATPGKHAIHIHQNPDCSSADAESAGGHWNPSKEMHGQFDIAPFHLGDIGNVDVGADGSGALRMTTNRWAINTKAENDVLGHSVVVHAAVDDLKTDPSGNSGSRQACGVIELITGK